MTHHRHRRNDQPAPRPPVALRISTEVLVALLRLDPAQHTIVGATIRQFGALQLIEFSVDAPNAPAGSVEMLPTYHHNGNPDPISLTQVTWLDVAGNETVQPLTPTLPAPASDHRAGSGYEQTGGYAAPEIDLGNLPKISPGPGQGNPDVGLQILEQPGADLEVGDR